MRRLPVLVDGSWIVSDSEPTFVPWAPRSGSPRDIECPVSNWDVVERVLGAGVRAYKIMQGAGPQVWAKLLRSFARKIKRHAEELALLADVETGLGVPRFLEVELPRTVDQLMQAANAAATESWREPVIDRSNRIASMMAPIPGPVCVMGPNNFPFAFNSACGGDAAAALATGHPVIAKANPGHPEVTHRLAQLGAEAAVSAGLDPSTFQLLYRLDHRDGERLVSDRRLAATAYTGSRRAGLKLKEAADRAGIPIYLELSSVNPVVVLDDPSLDPTECAETLSVSMRLGSGQFCTSPGLVFLLQSDFAEAFVVSLVEAHSKAPGQTLLSHQIASDLLDVVELWKQEGATVVVEGQAGAGFTFPHTVLGLSGNRFLAEPKVFQREAFGNVALVIVCAEETELLDCLAALDGNLTGTIFGQTSASTRLPRQAVASALRDKVGRLLADKAPTGVAVVDAMNHGGPFPSTGHPGFTAVGFPSSMRRFLMLQCFDNVPDGLLPPPLKADNPLGLQRRVDGWWTDEPIVWGV